VGTLTIDCRVLGMSGIGVYLEHILPLVLQSMPGTHFRLIGNENTLTRLLPDIDSVRIIPCSAPLYSFSEQYALPRLLLGSDAFWSPHYVIPLLTRIPMAVTVHDVAHLALPEFCGLKRLYARLMFRRICRTAKVIMTVSDFSARELQKYCGKPSAPVTVTSSGVAPEWFANTQEETPAAFPYAIVVGNVKAHKNIERACQAWRLIQKKTDLHLVILGRKEGFIGGKLDADTLAKYAPGRIHFLGKETDTAVHSWVQHARLLLFPSLYEGFGLPPLEAMAKGVPVVASAIPPVHEVVGDAAIFVDPLREVDIARGILSCLEMDELARDALTKRGRARARLFSWERTAHLAIAALRPFVSEYAGTS